MGTQPSLGSLFLSGLKAGALTFGGAYTVIPFLRDDAVGNGWMTDAQFLDGLALSGILPAPLIIFSTFVGGPLGAVAMTVGIFLPAFGFSLLFYERLEQVVENRTLHGFLEGVAAAVVGLIAATTVELTVTLVWRLPSLPLESYCIGIGSSVRQLRREISMNDSDPSIWIPNPVREADRSPRLTRQTATA